MDIHIRHSHQGDIDAIRHIYSQPSCYAGTLQLPCPSPDRWQQFLGKMPDNFYSLVAEQDTRIIGQLGMEVFNQPRRKHVANIGMAVDEAHRGQGAANALLDQACELAFNWLAVRRIELEVYTDNQTALSLYQQAGFVIEGTAKGYAFRDGQYADVHLMAKLSD